MFSTENDYGHLASQTWNESLCVFSPFLVNDMFKEIQSCQTFFLLYSVEHTNLKWIKSVFAGCFLQAADDRESPAEDSRRARSI